MMAIRLIELHRVLKPTGSIYLHCDPTASHYLKVVMDSIFGPMNFRNEIIWKRTSIHGDPIQYGAVHDILLYYSRSPTEWVWNRQYTGHDKDYVKSHYRSVDKDGRHYMLDNATAAGPGPSRVFLGKELAPPPGTHWRWSQENIDQLTRQGRILMTKNGRPRFKRYLDEMKGAPIGDV
jgi:hypothetical protein